MVKAFSKAALADQGSRLELGSPRLFSPSRFLSLPPPPFIVCSRGVEDEGFFDLQSLYLRLCPSLVQLDDVESLLRLLPLLESLVCCSAEEGGIPREACCELSVQVSTLFVGSCCANRGCGNTSGPLKEPHQTDLRLSSQCGTHTNAER